MAADHSDGQSWRETRAHKDSQSEPAAIAAPMLEAPPKRRRKRSRQDLVEPAPELHIEEALQEISTVPAMHLHRAAAYYWAARAVACYRVCLGKAEVQEGLSYLYLGEHYREAALAHAALGEAWGPMYEEVVAVMDLDRREASVALQRRSLAHPAAAP